MSLDRWGGSLRRSLQALLGRITLCHRADILLFRDIKLPSFWPEAAVASTSWAISAEARRLAVAAPVTAAGGCRKF
jgi:hypothetical protein